jgi:hypothetical protein
VPLIAQRDEETCHVESKSQRLTESSMFGKSTSEVVTTVTDWEFTHLDAPDTDIQRSVRDRDKTALPRWSTACVVCW